MINLLPPDVKQSYHYARRNVRLVRWMTAIGFALVGLAGISIGGQWYLKQSVKQYTEQVSTAEATLKKQVQAKVEKQVQDISNNLKLAVQVLSKEVLFSELLKQLAVVTPTDAKLSNLAISKIQGAVDISASTTDYKAATQLQLNLADPANKIFSKADIVSISCSSAATSADPLQSKYPCTVLIRALFAPNNPFLFINGTTSKTSTPAKPSLPPTLPLSITPKAVTP